VKRLFSYVSLLVCLAYLVPLILGLFIPRGGNTVIGAILALPLIPVFIRAAVRFFRSSRTTVVQVEFGALFVVLTALLVQLTGFVDSPFYPLMYLTASILALVLRPVIGLCLLILQAAVDVAPRLTWPGHPFVVNTVLMEELILLLFFGFFLLYTRIEARRHREMSRRLVRYEDDISGISSSVFDRGKGISEEKIGRQAVRALRSIDDFLFDILNRTKKAIGVDTVAYLVPAGNNLFRVREAASSDEKFDFEARPNLQTYRVVMTRGEPALLSAGQGPRGFDTGYYTGRPSGAACMAIVPVTDGRTVSGLLVCDGRIAGGISEKDIRFLEVVGATIRHAEKSIMEYQRLRVGLEEHEGLYDISTRLADAKGTEDVFKTVYDSCKTLIPATTAMAITRAIQSDSQVLSIHGEDLASVADKTFPNAGSLVGWVIETGKVLAYPQKERKRDVFGRQIDFPAGGSLVIFPLLSEEGVIGTCCLLIASPKTPSSFHNRLIELILSMAVASWMRIESKQMLERQAVTDPLTGLHNRRSFTKAYGRMVEHADRYAEPISLLMIDIDRFKGINDTYGHAAGDEVIKAVADTILSSIRKVDVAARIGGEEFAVILPMSPKKSSLATAERIRKAIQGQSIPHGRASIAVTVSIGVATRSGGGTIPDTLIKEADRYLYAAKEGGRDRCETS
jgi:diguanylate cyclase (GGDEF)-like protein